MVAGAEDGVMRHTHDSGSSMAGPLPRYDDEISVSEPLLSPPAWARQPGPSPLHPHQPEPDSGGEPPERPTLVGLQTNLEAQEQVASPLWDGEKTASLPASPEARRSSSAFPYMQRSSAAQPGEATVIRRREPMFGKDEETMILPHGDAEADAEDDPDKTRILPVANQQAPAVAGGGKDDTTLILSRDQARAILDDDEEPVPTAGPSETPPPPPEQGVSDAPPPAEVQGPAPFGAPVSESADAATLLIRRDQVVVTEDGEISVLGWGAAESTAALRDGGSLDEARPTVVEVGDPANQKENEATFPFGLFRETSDDGGRPLPTTSEALPPEWRDKLDADDITGASAGSGRVSQAVVFPAPGWPPESEAPSASGPDPLAAGSASEALVPSAAEPTPDPSPVVDLGVSVGVPPPAPRPDFLDQDPAPSPVSVVLGAESAEVEPEEPVELAAPVEPGEPAEISQEIPRAMSDAVQVSQPSLAGAFLHIPSPAPPPPPPAEGLSLPWESSLRASPSAAGQPSQPTSVPQPFGEMDAETVKKPRAAALAELISFEGTSPSVPDPAVTEQTRPIASESTLESMPQQATQIAVEPVKEAERLDTLDEK